MYITNVSRHGQHCLPAYKSSKTYQAHGRQACVTAQELVDQICWLVSSAGRQAMRDTNQHNDQYINTRAEECS